MTIQEFARKFQLELTHTKTGRPIVKGDFGTFHEMDGEVVAIIRITDNDQRLRAFRAVKPHSLLYDNRSARETKKIRADAAVKMKQRFEEVLAAEEIEQEEREL